ncbi:MAG: radical SAM protein [Nanoarchaeota archaeon]|nr:radical SAM protein [Nanoarchaeota archaeon]
MVNAYPQATQHTREDFLAVPTSPYVNDFTAERKQQLVALLADEGDVRLLKFHQSLCPGCVEDKQWNTMKIDAVTYLKHNKVWIKKSCPKHGPFKEVYWSDYGLYQKAERFQDPGIEIQNPHIEKGDINCPTDCGLCANHESHTGLGNIVVTNRCDLSCWYCFFYSKEGDPIYEPTMDQMKLMLSRMRDEKPVGANSVQFTGGEPTLREDLIDIIKLAKELGYDHIQLNTNGINLSRDPNLPLRLREAGVSNLYMSFDGMAPSTNPKNYWEAQQAIENCHKAGIGVVLVPTVIGGVNDHELGDIIRFASGNIHAVRAVNFQPVSLVGRMPERQRRKQRITIPGSINRIQAQTAGEISKDAWFPVPCAKQITDFIEALKQEPKYRLSVHFSCGMATYVFKDEHGKLIPLPSFVDVEGFFNYLGELTRELTGSKHRKIKKKVVLAKLLLNLNKFVDSKKKPQNLNIVKLLSGAVGGGNYHGLAAFHLKSLFLGMMHFQDPYNWDIDRVHKCDIHYAVPDGRVLPFCTFNVIPGLYRDKVQEKFSIPRDVWERKTGKQLKDDMYHRNISSEQMRKIKEQYNHFIKPVGKVTTEDDAFDPDSLQTKTPDTVLAAAATIITKNKATAPIEQITKILTGNTQSYGSCDPTYAIVKPEELIKRRSD